MSWSRAPRLVGPTAPGRLRRVLAGGDLLAVLVSGDLDAAGLGPLVYRDGQGEDAGTVVGADVLCVEGVAEEHLTSEDPCGTLGDQHLGVVGLLGAALGPDGQDVLFNGQVDGLGADAGQV